MEVFFPRSTHDLEFYNRRVQRFGKTRTSRRNNFIIPPGLVCHSMTRPCYAIQDLLTPIFSYPQSPFPLSLISERNPPLLLKFLPLDMCDKFLGDLCKASADPGALPGTAQVMSDSRGFETLSTTGFALNVRHRELKGSTTGCICSLPIITEEPQKQPNLA